MQKCTRTLNGATPRPAVVLSIRVSIQLFIHVYYKKKTSYDFPLPLTKPNLKESFSIFRYDTASIVFVLVSLTNGVCVLILL